MSDLGPANKFMCPDDVTDENSDGEGPNAMEVPPPRLKSLNEAMYFLSGRYQ